MTNTLTNIGVKNKQKNLVDNDSTTGQPIYTDCRGVEKLFSIKRSNLYDLTKTGRVKSVSLLQPHQTRGRRLWLVSSVKAYLDSLLADFAEGNGEGGAE